MCSLHLGKNTEKCLIGNRTNSVFHGSQPDSSGTHVTEQDTAINPTTTQVRSEQGTTNAIQEKSDIRVQAHEHPEYPRGLKLATITVAVALSVFLVALVRSPEILPATSRP
jgi:hypothetical protein